MTHFCKSCKSTFSASDCLYWNDGAQRCHDECCADECYPCFYETIVASHTTMSEPTPCNMCNLSFHETTPWDTIHNPTITCTECHVFFLQHADEFDADSD